MSIHVKGEAKGVKLQGGVLDFPNRDVEIEVLPTEIPEHLEIDVTELTIGQGVRLRDIAEGAKWTPVSDPDTLLLHVVAPRAEEAAPEARRRARRARSDQEGQAGEGRGVKLIAGLGNPGAKYRETLHNVGFEVVDELARRHGVIRSRLRPKR